MSTVNYENICMYMSKSTPMKKQIKNNSWRKKYRKLREAANFDQLEHFHFEVGTQLR